MLAEAERLHKLAPKDEWAAKRLAEIRSRAKAADQRERLTQVPWAAPPEKTPLGYSIDWMTGFRRIEFAEDFDAAVLADPPGRAFVAAGLALQGIDQGPMRLNLLRSKHGSMLEKFSRLLLKRPVHSVWGIDLSSSGLKAVKLRLKGDKHPKVLLEAVVYIEHKKPLSQAANDIEENALVAETFDRFTSQDNLKADRICLAVPGRIVLLRELTLPTADPAKVPELMQFEIKHHVPINLNDLAWDYQLLGPSGADGASRTEHPVVLLAVKQNLLDKRINWFKNAGLHVDVAQCDALALHNLLAYEHFANGQSEEDDAEPQDVHPEPKVTAVLDVGHDESNLVFSSPNHVWFRNLGVGGHSFTRAMVQEFDLTYTEADRQKREPVTAPRFSRFDRALQPVFADLVAEVQRAIEKFTKNSPHRPIERLVGTGGGFAVHGLLRHLRSGR